MKTRIPSWGIPVFLIGAVVLPHSANSATFDISRDFSVASNPNGAWSYGWKTTLDGSFTLLTFAKTNIADNGVPHELWALNSFEQPAVLRNGTTNTAIVAGGQGNYPPGTVWFLPGYEGRVQNYGVIRCAVPMGAGGQYEVNTVVRPGFDGSIQGDTDFHVLKNGMELFGRQLAAGASASYSNTVLLTAGDTIDFAIGRGADNSYLGAVLKIEATLDLVSTNAPPPPGDTNCLVAPRIATTQDEAFGAATLRAPNHRNQQVYDARHFPTGVVMNIHQIRFRPDYFYGNAFTATVQNIQINLSTTARPVEQMSAVFAQNVGVDDRVVFSGALALSSSFSGPADGPKAFDIVVPLSAPFTYNPAQGNLVLDIRNFSGSSASLLSGRTDSTDGVSRVLGSVNSTSGLTDIGGDVLQVCFTATNAPPPPRPTNCVLAGAELVAWWPFNGDAREVISGGLLQLAGGPTFISGEVGGALSFDGSNDEALMPASAALNVGLAGGFSIETWINPAHVTLQPIATWTPGPGVGGVHFWLGVYGAGSIFANLVDTAGGNHSWRSETDIVVPNQWQHVGMSYQKAAGLLRFYLNGVKVTEHLLGTLEPQTSYPLAIGYRPNQEHLAGSIDELSIYRRVLTDSEFAAIHAAGSLGKCGTNTPPPPTGLLLVVPSGLESREGDSASGILTDQQLRLQEVYAASQFPTGTLLISQLRLRPSVDFGTGAFSISISNIQINLSTTPRQPNNLSLVFAENIGADDTVVHSGRLDVATQFSGPEQGPKTFDIIVPLQRPFAYNPAAGNLLVDIRNFSGFPVRHVIDLEAGHDGASRLIAHSASATTAFIADPAADVLQIVYSQTNVPPPPPPGDTNCVVAPRIATTQDEAFGASTLSTANLRNQQVYDARHFPTGVVMSIHQIRFRPDYFYGRAFTTTVQNIQINLSTTTHQPEQLSAVFAQNVGADDRIVFSGALSISSSFGGPAGGPKAFDIVVPLSTPFTFNPSQGNLVVDIRNFSGSSASLLSGRTDSTDGVSRVLGSVNSLSGTVDIGGGDVLQVCFTATNAPPPPPPGDTNCAVVPRIAVTQDEAFGSSTLSTPNHRNQQVYNASHFPTGVVMNIHEIRFRPDYFYGHAFTATVQNIQVNVSTTLRQAEQLSAVFTQNVGADDRIVFSGALNISSSFSGPANGPKAFDIVVPLSTPFTYDPSQGNLLVDIRNFSGSSASLLSGRTDSTDGISRVLGSVNSTSGLTDIGGDVLQVCFTATNAPPTPVGDYDLSRDFSGSSNPNGAWGYGWKTTLDGSFTLLTFPKTDLADNGVPIELWALNSFEQPAVLHNGTTNIATASGGQGNYPPGTTWFLPGYEGRIQNYCVIRFTVPAGSSGRYELSTVVQPAFDGSIQGDTDFHVLRNGVELFGRQLAAGSSANYSEHVSLAAGDTIDFAIGRGADNSYLGSALKIQATLDLVSTNPPPPRITSQPQNQNVIVGSDVTFTVTASGAAPLSYQWRFNETHLIGETNPSLALAHVQMANAGNYSVLVSNSVGFVISSNAVLMVRPAPTRVRVVNITAPSGGTIDLPIELEAQGAENALGFSLSFNPSLLEFSDVALASGTPAGTTLITNTNETSGGRLGLAVALPSGASFPAGTQQVAKIRFEVAPVLSPVTIPIAFSDQPTVRQVSDQQARSLPAEFLDGNIAVSRIEFESDSAPRPDGDQQLTIIDWVQVGRFVAGLDTPSSAEYQRADCAPRSTRGNGLLAVTDWVQAGRYATGLDPITPAGGPTNPATAAGVVAAMRSASGMAASERMLSLPETNVPAGSWLTIPVLLHTQGNENAVGFSVVFDPARMTFAGATSGAGLTNAALNVNSSQAAAGRIGLALALPTGGLMNAGENIIVLLRFFAATNALGSNAITFGNAPVVREISDVVANSLECTYSDGIIIFSPPLPVGPNLRITRSGGSIILFWPATDRDFLLEGAAGIPASEWSPVNVTPVEIGGQRIVTLPVAGSHQYFRLQKP